MKKFVLSLVLVIAILGVAVAGDITPQGMSQADLVSFLSNVVTLVNELKAENNLSVGAANNMCLTHSGAVKTAVDGTTLTTDEFDYVIGGVTYDNAATNTMAIAATEQAKGTSCKYLFSINAAGTVATTKGTAVTYGSTAVYPALPANSAPFAAANVDILSDATAAFTLGTTAFNYDASATVTIYAITTVPSGTSAPSSITTSDLSLTGL